MKIITAYMALNGDDATGELDNPAKPYRTHAKCIEVLQPLEAPEVKLNIGDLIWVGKPPPRGTVILT